MPISLRELLRPPTLADPEDTRIARLVHRLLLACIPVNVAILLSQCFLASPRRPNWWLTALLLACSPLWLWLVRRGRLRLVGASISVLGWIALLVGTLLSGGIRSHALLVAPVLLLFTGFVWSLRAAATSATAAVCVTMALAWADSRGLLAASYPAGSLEVWIALAASLSLTAVILVLAVRGIRRALEESERSRRRLDELVTHSPDGILSLDAAGRIESLNPAGAEILGRAPEAVRGHVLAAIAGLDGNDATHMERAFASVMGGGAPAPVAVRVQRPDATLAHCEITCRRREGEDGRVLCHVTLHDVTGQRELQESLLQSQKLDAVGKLAGGVAHDFNNFLTVILMNVELARQTLPSDHALQAELGEVRSAASRSAALTRQLLTFSRKQHLKPQVVDPNGLIDGLRGMLSRVLGESIRLRTALDPEVGSLYLDPGQLEVALVNLAVNARDAMSGGGVLSIASHRVKIPARGHTATPGLPAGDYVCLTVRDQGCGMSEDIRARVFEPFFTTKPEGHGTGLGLATVHGIVTQTGGAVTLESRLGEGSTFRLYLPRTELPAAAAREEPAAASTLPLRGEGTILLVEDQPLLRRIARAALEEHGYRVIEACDGLEALDQVEYQGIQPDLLVSDVVMPRMGGVELAATLRGRMPALPVLFVSGYSDVAPPGVGGPGNALLQKPFEARDLLAAVLRALAEDRVQAGKTREIAVG